MPKWPAWASGSTPHGAVGFALLDPRVARGRELRDQVWVGADVDLKRLNRAAEGTIR